MMSKIGRDMAEANVQQEDFYSCKSFLSRWR